MKRYTGNSITADINSELIPFLNLNIKQRLDTNTCLISSENDKQKSLPRDVKPPMAYTTPATSEQQRGRVLNVWNLPRRSGTKW